MSDITVSIPYDNLAEADRLLRIPRVLYDKMHEHLAQSKGPSLDALNDYPGWRRVVEVRHALGLPMGGHITSDAVFPFGKEIIES